MFALNTMPIAATGALPYATKIWFNTIVDTLISMEKTAVGSPVTHTPRKMPSLQVKYLIEMEKHLLFFKKYHR